MDGIACLRKIHHAMADWKMEDDTGVMLCRFIQTLMMMTYGFDFDVLFYVG